MKQRRHLKVALLPQLVLSELLMVEGDQFRIVLLMKRNHWKDLVVGNSQVKMISFCPTVQVPLQFRQDSILVTVHGAGFNASNT